MTRRGDTLVSIADRFGVSLDQLRRWNKIPGGIRVEPGRRLHVAEPASLPHAGRRGRASTSSQNTASREKLTAKGAAHASPGGKKGTRRARGEATHKTSATSGKSVAHASSRSSKQDVPQKLYAKRQK